METFRDYLDYLVAHQHVRDYNELTPEQRVHLTGLYYRDVTPFLDQSQELLDSDYGYQYPAIVTHILLGTVDVERAIGAIKANLVRYFEDRLVDCIEEAAARYRREYAHSMAEQGFMENRLHGNSVF